MLDYTEMRGSNKIDLEPNRSYGILRILKTVHFLLELIEMQRHHVLKLIRYIMRGFIRNMSQFYVIVEDKNMKSTNK